MQYETASKKFYHGQNVPVLLCLCRSWYAKANKDQSFGAMRTALKYAQQVRSSFLLLFRGLGLMVDGVQAMHLTPGDKAIIYNVAMIQQKAAEMLFKIGRAHV